MKKVKRKVGYGESEDDAESEDGASPPTAMKRLHLDDLDRSHGSDQAMGI